MEELSFDLGPIGSRHLARFSNKSSAIKKLIKDEKLAEDIRLLWLNVCAKENDDQEARNLLERFLEKNKSKLDGSYYAVRALFKF